MKNCRYILYVDKTSVSSTFYTCICICSASLSVFFAVTAKKKITSFYAKPSCAVYLVMILKSLDYCF